MEPPSTPIKLQTQLKIFDFYELYLRSALLRAWYGRMVVALFLIVLIAILEGSIEFLRPLLEPPLLYVEIVVIAYSILLGPYFSARARVQSTMGSDGTNSYVFSENGIDIQGDHFEAHFDWAAVRRAKQSQHLLILYTGGNSAIVIPKRCFASPQQLSDFRALVTNQVKRRYTSPASTMEAK